MGKCGCQFARPQGLGGSKNSLSMVYLAAAGAPLLMMSGKCWAVVLVKPSVGA